MKFDSFIHIMHRLVDIFMIVVFIILFVIGSYGLYDSYLVYQEAKDSSMLSYKPDLRNNQNQKICKDMIGWLTIDRTKIDFPIMQGKTNYEYLNKNPYGDYSLSGSIFLDASNDASFINEYNLIHGHHMEGGNDVWKPRFI